MARVATSFKTDVFRLHDPSKQRQAMLDQALRLGHLTYIRALQALLAELPGLIAEPHHELLLAKDRPEVAQQATLLPGPGDHCASARADACMSFASLIAVAWSI